ncbi:hypothetical protein [Pseudorhodobacter sp.]|uniref:hypothetical protein n=1 Tax=Pseudorhodobacter sp. TaxID=1934400 RepID=UPI0026490363|nr:hypothetical protein [Pseudorhodobacter sp.]MDN5786517.1 hypothetical protein [Pseudorhodobacter sp.]
MTINTQNPRPVNLDPFIEMDPFRINRAEPTPQKPREYWLDLKDWTIHGREDDGLIQVREVLE